MLSNHETKILARLLRKVKFPLPPEIFNAWVENLPHVGYELAVMRSNSVTKKLEVFLTQRPADDLFWPNEWHIPGTVIRQNETLDKVYKRLIKNEVGLKKEKLGIPQQQQIFNIPKGDGHGKCQRGHVLSLFYSVTFSGKKIEGGTFFPIDKIPRKIVAYHKVLLRQLRTQHR